MPFHRTTKKNMFTIGEISIMCVGNRTTKQENHTCYSTIQSR